MKKFSNFGFYLPADIARVNDISYKHSPFQEKDGKNLQALRNRLLRAGVESSRSFNIDASGLNISLSGIEANMGFSRYDNPDFVPGK